MQSNAEGANRETMGVAEGKSLSSEGMSSMRHQATHIWKDESPARRSGVCGTHQKDRTPEKSHLAGSMVGGVATKPHPYRDELQDESSAGLRCR